MKSLVVAVPQGQNGVFHRSFAALFFVTGALLLCFIRGGLLNWHRSWDGSTWIGLEQPGHIVGFVLIGLSAVMMIFLFSLEKRP